MLAILGQYIIPCAGAKELGCIMWKKAKCKANVVRDSSNMRR